MGRRLHHDDEVADGMARGGEGTGACWGPLSGYASRLSWCGPSHCNETAGSRAAPLPQRSRRPWKSVPGIAQVLWRGFARCVAGAAGCASCSGSAGALKASGRKRRGAGGRGFFRAACTVTRSLQDGRRVVTAARYHVGDRPPRNSPRPLHRRADSRGSKGRANREGQELLEHHRNRTTGGQAPGRRVFARGRCRSLRRILGAIHFRKGGRARFGGAGSAGSRARVWTNAS